MTRLEPLLTYIAGTSGHFTNYGICAYLWETDYVAPGLWFVLATVIILWDE